MYSKLGVNLFSTGIIALIKFLELRYLSIQLSEYELGVYAILAVYISISQMIVEMGIQNAVYSIKSIAKINSDLIVIGWIKALSYVLILSLLILFNDKYELIDISNFTHVFYAALLIVLIISPIRYVRNSIISSGGVKEIAVLEFVSSIVAFSFFYFYIKEIGLIAVVISMLIKSTIEAVYYYTYSIRRYGFKLSLRWSYLKDTITIGTWDSASQLLNILSKEVDTFIIVSRLGYEVVGVYGIIKQFLTRLIRIFIPPINNVFYQYISPRNSLLNNAIKLHRKVVWLAVLLLFSIVSSTSTFWLDYFLQIPSKTVSQWLNMLIIGVALRALWGGVAPYILSFGITKRAFYLNLLVFFIIVPTYQVFGMSITGFVAIYLIQVLILITLGWYVYYRQHLDLTQYYIPVVSVILILYSIEYLPIIFDLLLVLLVVVYIAFDVVNTVRGNEYFETKG